MYPVLAECDAFLCREMFKFLVAYFFYSDTYSTVASVGILVIQQVRSKKTRKKTERMDIKRVAKALT